MKTQKSKKTTKKAAAKPLTNVDYFQKKLESMQADLLKTVSKKREEALPDPDVGDEGDVAARSVARDLVFELTDNEKHLLDEVEAALRRIEKKVYGLCEACGDTIKSARLKFMPYARYCIKCQSRFERV